ncbi:MAG: Sensor histidine kinase TmoS [candidate division BRC1 bacterium ADurb.BinA364]|nr:MAG: Sensor histidine kinase TmoS [candidate division BRC1 bacterium ADurb.BinA364]
MARRVEERLRPVAALRGIRVEVLVAGSVPAMPLDGSLFERVAQNLLSNAIEHSPDGERVTLELRFEPRPPGLAMRVEDRGPGVPPGEREAIFEKFRQGRTRAGAGSGLGLAFCKLALDAHHGSIAVEEGEAGGARFVAFWPLLALDGSPATN